MPGPKPLGVTDVGQVRPAYVVCFGKGGSRRPGPPGLHALVRRIHGQVTHGVDSKSGAPDVPPQQLAEVTEALSHLDQFQVRAYDSCINGRMPV